jgi:hypothetical protein
MRRNLADVIEEQQSDPIVSVSSDDMDEMSAITSSTWGTIDKDKIARRSSSKKRRKRKPRSKSKLQEPSEPELEPSQELDHESNMPAGKTEKKLPSSCSQNDNNNNDQEQELPPETNENKNVNSKATTKKKKLKSQKNLKDAADEAIGDNETDPLSKQKAKKRKKKREKTNEATGNVEKIKTKKKESKQKPSSQRLETPSPAVGHESEPVSDEKTKKKKSKTNETNPKKKRKSKAKSATTPSKETSVKSDHECDVPYERTEKFSQIDYDMERGHVMECDEDPNNCNHNYSYNHHVVDETRMKGKEKRYSEEVRKGMRHSESTRKTIAMDSVSSFNYDVEDRSLPYSSSTMDRYSGHHRGTDADYAYADEHDDDAYMNGMEYKENSNGSLYSGYFYGEDSERPSFKKVTLDLADTTVRNTKCCIIAAGIFFTCTTVGFSILIAKLTKRGEW